MSDHCSIVLRSRLRHVDDAVHWTNMVSIELYEGKAVAALQAAMTAILPHKVETYDIGGHEGMVQFPGFLKAL